MLIYSIINVFLTSSSLVFINILSTFINILIIISFSNVDKIFSRLFFTLFIN